MTHVERWWGENMKSYEPNPEATCLNCGKKLKTHREGRCPLEVDACWGKAGSPFAIAPTPQSSSASSSGSTSTVRGTQEDVQITLTKTETLGSLTKTATASGPISRKNELIGILESILKSNT